VMVISPLGKSSLVRTLHYFVFVVPARLRDARSSFILSQKAKAGFRGIVMWHNCSAIEKSSP